VYFMARGAGVGEGPRSGLAGPVSRVPYIPRRIGARNNLGSGVRSVMSGKKPKKNRQLVLGVLVGQGTCIYSAKKPAFITLEDTKV